jgi:hypothetical protein
MPDLIRASSNMARAIRTWSTRTQPSIMFVSILLAAIAPAAATALAGAIGGLSLAVVALAAAIRAAAATARGHALATRAARRVPSWLTILLLILTTITLTVLVLRWLDRRRAHRACAAVV